jgi:glyoxylase-like metal-dependent hydrolase (beta-lactamase superfamily II)
VRFWDVLMIIQLFPSGPLSTNAIVAASGPHRLAFIIDPAAESASHIEQYIDKHHLTVSMILLTHGHWDHIVDVAVLKERYQVPVAIHAEDALNLQQPAADGLPLFFPIKGVKPDRLLQDGDVLMLDDIVFEVLHLPGHSPGAVGYYSAQEKVLISGDVLFHGTIGSLSLPTAQPQRMWSSLERLAALPPDTKVYPGHGEPTTIGRERWLSQAEEFFS